MVNGRTPAPFRALALCSAKARLPSCPALSRCAACCNSSHASHSPRILVPAAGFTLLDRKLNSQLYGAAIGAQPNAVLGGCVPAPPELELLYRDIEMRAAEAQVCVGREAVSARLPRTPPPDVGPGKSSSCSQATHGHGLGTGCSPKPVCRATGCAVEGISGLHDLSGAPIPHNPPPLLPHTRRLCVQIVRPTVSKFEMARWQAAQFADWSNRGLDRSARGGRCAVGALCPLVCPCVLQPFLSKEPLAASMQGSCREVLYCTT